MIKESDYTVNKNGCWVWSGKKCSSGRYGYLYENKKMIMSHRKSYIQHKGEIPNGLFVCHTCDNGLCVNPEHLFLGTNSDNMKDAYKKGRLHANKLSENQKGEYNLNSKYNLDFANEVRDFYSKNKVSFSELSKIFGLKSRGHAHAIVARKIWNY